MCLPARPYPAVALLVLPALLSSQPSPPLKSPAENTSMPDTLSFVDVTEPV